MAAVFDILSRGVWHAWISTPRAGGDEQISDRTMMEENLHVAAGTRFYGAPTAHNRRNLEYASLPSTSRDSIWVP